MSKCFAGGDWIALIPFVGTVSLIAYVTVKAFQPKPPVEMKPRCNLKIQKEVQKVVNIVDIEEIGEKVSYCRCWRSKRVRSMPILYNNKGCQIILKKRNICK